MMFDTHCHLNFSRFKKNVDEVITAAEAVGVNRIIVPGTDVESSQKAVEIAGRYEGIYAAVGIHPHHVFEQGASLDSSPAEPDQNDGIKELLQNDVRGKIVAIGEIGLDRHEYKDTKYENYQIDENFITAQKELFVVQLKLAKEFKKSVIVHNREAKADILPLITENWDESFRGRMVLHCCEPDPELLEFATHYNIYIGIDGDVTYRPDKQTFIKTVPLEKLVLETDSPFLLPRLPAPEAAGNGGQAEPLQLKYPNVPANIPLIAQFVANLKGVSVEEIAAQTTENARSLFHLSDIIKYYGRR